MKKKKVYYGTATKQKKIGRERTICINGRHGDIAFTTMSERLWKRKDNTEKNQNRRAYPEVHTVSVAMFPYTNSSSSTTLEAPSSPFFPFSLSFLDDSDDGLLVSHLLSQHHSLFMINNAPAAAEVNDHVVITEASPATATNMIISNGVGGDKAMIPKKRRQQQQVLPRKKTGKKDRHSKICTAHGLRDRRMRLSVKVARKFFDLQDMLDFDKASKTIEWLLVNSRAAIQELAAQSQLQQLPDSWNNNGHEKSMSSSASMSEVVSETNKEMEIMQTGEESVAAMPKRKRRKSCRAAISVNPLARESRDMARARARERTREKMMIQRSHNTQSTDDSGFTHAIGDHMDTTTIEPTAGCYAMTSKNPSLGNARVQNMKPNLQEHNNKLPSTSLPSSIFMTVSNNGHWSNPSSFFVPAPNTQDHQQNPISNPNFMSSATSSNIGFESHGFMGNQFQ